MTNDPRKPARQRAVLTEYARHDRMHCVALGLFLPRTDPSRARRKLDVTVAQPNGASVRFWGPEPLTGFDLLVLQGLVAYAGKHGTDLASVAGNESEQTAKQSLASALESAVINWERAPRLYFATSYWRFAQEIGVRPETAHNYAKDLQRSLERLYSVTMIYEADGVRLSTRMISSMAVGERPGRLAVAINTPVSRAVIGGVFTKINMAEVRRLRRDPTRILHQHLCAILFEDGRVREFSLGTLVEYVFPAALGEVSPRTLRKRKASVRIAMQEIAALGWAVRQKANGVYAVARPVRRIPASRPAGRQPGVRKHA